MKYETLASLHADVHAIPACAQDRSQQKARRLAQARFENAKLEAINEFAVSRGWRRAHTSFSLPQLAAGRPGRSSTDDYSWRPEESNVDAINLAWDHPYFFRETRRPYRPASVVVHLYSRAVDPGYQYARQLAAFYDLNFEPLPWSWYYPASCIAGVYVP